MKEINKLISDRSSNLILDLSKIKDIIGYLKNYYLNKIMIITNDIGKLKNINSNTLVMKIGGKSDFFLFDFLFDDGVISIGGFNLKIDCPIEFSAYLGCKIIISEHDFKKTDYLFQKKGVSYFRFDELSQNEYSNIINFRNLVVLRHEDENYTVSGLVRNLIKSFDRMSFSNIFLKNGFKIITTKNIMEGHYIKKEIDDFLEMACNKHHVFGDFIAFGIHPFGLYELKKIFGTNIKKVVWLDDLHYFANFVDRKGVSIQKFSEKYRCLELDMVDYLISPSLKYFKNLGIDEHDNKLVDLFYMLNYDYFEVIDNDYDNREDKIILSGEVNNGYPIRKEFKMLKEKSSDFESMIYHLVHPGYSDNEHMTEMNFYSKLTNFKGAFVGHYSFPLDFALAKHIEVLMCGCLGFFERNDILKSQLGLEEFVHYIPCTDENGELIKDFNFYMDWIKSEEGKRISIKGSEYVRDRFGEKYVYEYIDFFKSIL
jgi:hypothetical protein